MVKVMRDLPSYQSFLVPQVHHLCQRPFCELANTRSPHTNSQTTILQPKPNTNSHTTILQTQPYTNSHTAILQTKPTKHEYIQEGLIHGRSNLIQLT